MIMIGLSLLFGALTLFIVLVFLEIYVGFHGESSPHHRITRIVTSPDINLALYELVAFLFTIGLPLFIEESQHPFLIEVWPTMIERMVVGVIFMISVPIINVVRYQRLGLDVRHAKGIYDVAASNAECDEDPERGLEVAISFINTKHSKFPGATERGFLEYLSSRDDQLGEIARQKLSTINSDSI